jgi:hypothetical protein
MFNPQTQKDYTYVYDVTTKSFGCDRASMEAIVQTAFGDVTTADVLLAPVQFFDNLLIEALGISVDTLCSMPFEKPTLKSVGFSKNESNASYTYEDKKSNFRITIHRPEWGDADDGNNLEWFQQMNGYNLVMWYNASKKEIIIQSDKGGNPMVKYTYSFATGKISDEYPDLDAVKKQMAATLNMQDTDILAEPLKLLDRSLQERFGMGLNELYVLPIE